MFPPQTFDAADIGVVAFLVVLEALLSADNALVLAMMVQHLPRSEQKRALFYGLGGSLVFRLIAILGATVVIRFWWLQIFGAVYLLWLSFKHFLGKSEEKQGKELQSNFWKTVLFVELTDIAFALDSVFAGVSTVGRHLNKLWVVYLGAMVGVVLLRVAANGFIKLLRRFPALDDVAYVIVGWVGVKLAFISLNEYEDAMRRNGTRSIIPFEVPELSPIVFWSILICIGTTGTILALRKKSASESL